MTTLTSGGLEFSYVIASTRAILPTSLLSRFPLVLLPNLALPLRELYHIVSILTCSYVTIDLENACYCLFGSGY